MRTQSRTQTPHIVSTTIAKTMVRAQENRPNDNYKSWGLVTFADKKGAKKVLRM